jgi:hypothetical protein
MERRPACVWTPAAPCPTNPPWLFLPPPRPAASWDPRREGSLLGWTEFQGNVPLLLDRFKRDR